MLELGCLLVVALWVVIRFLLGARRWVLVAEAAAIMVMAWASEQTCISFYGFYAYADRWRLMLGDVPLTVVVIWPVVVLSARDVIGAFMGVGIRDPLPEAEPLSVARLALASLMVVTFDAAFVEPAAVDAGLWAWTEPGVFGVPLIGIVGWGLFGAMMVGALELRGRTLGWAAPLLVVPALHLALLGLWWGLFRYVTLPLPDSVMAIAMMCVATAVAAVLARSPRSAVVPASLVLLRLPGALFFVVLMGSGNPPTLLVVWSLAISVPWAVMVLRASGAGWGALRVRR
jgi:hypothetical protein